MHGTSSRMEEKKYNIKLKQVSHHRPIFVAKSISRDSDEDKNGIANKWRMFANLYSTRFIQLKTYLIKRQTLFARDMWKGIRLVSERPGDADSQNLINRFMISCWSAISHLNTLSIFFGCF